MTKFNSAFWRWFKHSQVVDEHGDPLLVYHGTQMKFSQFSADPDLDADVPVYYFTPQIKYAEVYAGRSGHIIPAYLSIQKLFDTRRPEHLRIVKRALKEDGYEPWEAKAYIEDYFCDGLPHWNNADAIRLAVANGFDGIMLCERKGKYASYGVFDPKQIKAADNDGSWDADDPDIRSNPRRRGCGY